PTGWPDQTHLYRTMTNMTKQSSGAARLAGTRACGIVVVLAIAVGGFRPVAAQSTLRFIAPEVDAASQSAPVADDDAFTTAASGARQSASNVTEIRILSPDGQQAQPTQPHVDKADASNAAKQKSTIVVRVEPAKSSEAAHATAAGNRSHLDVFTQLLTA